jgi:hypothetical protein
MDQLNDKYGKEGQTIDDLAQGYIDKDPIIMRSETVRKVVEDEILKYIQKASEKKTFVDLKSRSKLKDALKAISNRRS